MSPVPPLVVQLIDRLEIYVPDSSPNRVVSWSPEEALIWGPSPCAVSSFNLDMPPRLFVETGS